MPLSWFLLLNKPTKFTSYDLVSVVKKKFNIKKVGHTGTLDPLATWLMILWIWDATKFLHWHKADKKSYSAKIKFWAISNTYDWEWVIEDKCFKWLITQQQLIEVIDSFKWKITQVPPQYSAIKIQWRKACNIMREWWDIKMPLRNVEIFKIEIIQYKYPNLELDITCSSWTYIRSIANDMWKKLWCWAYLAWLVRTWIENFSLDQAIEVDDISSEKILALDFWLQHLEKLEVSAEIIQRLKNWHRIKNENDLQSWNKENNIWREFRIYSSWKFYWIWEINWDILKWKKIIFS